MFIKSSKVISFLQTNSNRLSGRELVDASHVEELEELLAPEVEDEQPGEVELGEVEPGEEPGKQEEELLPEEQGPEEHGPVVQGTDELGTEAQGTEALEVEQAPVDVPFTHGNVALETVEDTRECRRQSSSSSQTSEKVLLVPRERVSENRVGRPLKLDGLTLEPSREASLVLDEEQPVPLEPKPLEPKPLEPPEGRGQIVDEERKLEVERVEGEVSELDILANFYSFRIIILIRLSLLLIKILYY